MKNNRLLIILVSFAFAVSLQAELVEHWSLDETETIPGFSELAIGGSATTASVFNSIRTGHTATYVKGASVDDAAPVYEVGIRNGSIGTQLRFARIELGQVAPGISPFTICIWFKRHSQYISGHDVDTSSSSQEHIISANQGQDGRWALNTYNLNSTDETFRLDWFHDHGLTLPGLSQNLNSDQWYHFAVTRDDAGIIKFYIDGTMVNSGVDSADFTCGTRGVCLGRDPGLTSGGARGFTGQFDDVRIYKNALTSAEITDIFSNSTSEYSPYTNAQFVDPAQVVLRNIGSSFSSIISYSVSLSEDQSAITDISSTASLLGTVSPNQALQWNAGNLDLNKTYYWRVDIDYSDGSKSYGVARSFKTEPVDIPGVIVAHSPKSSVVYLGSPCITILDNGDYVATCDEFGDGSTYNTTLVFKSKDHGKTWKQISTVEELFWPSLFVHNGSLYLIGVKGRYKDDDTVIRRSDDGGATWTKPIDENSGLLNENSFHNAPTVHVIHNNRIWFAMNDALGTSTTGGFCSTNRMCLMSASVDADLLKASNWIYSSKLDFDETNWNYDWFTTHGGWLESNVVLGPDNKLLSMPRVDTNHFSSNLVEKAAIISFGSYGIAPSFNPDNDFVDFPGGCKKFCIRYDDNSQKYWALSTPVLSQHRDYDIERARNALALMYSEDLRNWTIKQIILYNSDIDYVGFQYPFYVFDGDDILAAIRLAYEDGLGGASNQHNSNFLMFYRIEDFRSPNKPSFVSYLEDAEVVCGQTATFKATVASGEDVSWKWYKRVDGGADIILNDGDNSGKIQITRDGLSSTLNIDDVKKDDEALYYCIAANTVGSTPSCTARLEIYKRKLTHHWKLDDQPNWADDVTSYILDSATMTSKAYIVAGASQSDRVNIVFQSSGAIPETNTSIKFDNKTERAILGDVSPRLKPFTISLWFKMEQFRGADNNQDHIISADHKQPNGWYINLYKTTENAPSLNFVHNGWKGGNNNSNSVIIADSIDSNRWYSVILTRKLNNEFSIYLDGTKVFSGINNISLTDDPVKGVWLARCPSYTSGFDGWIDDVCFYNYAIDDKPDLNGDALINISDFNRLAAYWLRSDCGVCDGADIDLNSRVDFIDLTELVKYWLEFSYNYSECVMKVVKKESHPSIPGWRWLGMERVDGTKNTLRTFTLFKLLPPSKSI